MEEKKEYSETRRGGFKVRSIKTDLKNNRKKNETREGEKPKQGEKSKKASRDI